MSILTANEIVELITSERLSIVPSLDSYQLQGHSIDLRLGYTFMVPRTWRLTPEGREALAIKDFDTPDKDSFEIVELEKGQYFDLLPGEYILVSTLEQIGLPDDLMAVLYPRSSTNRKGLSVDLTGIIDAGYKGQLIIPLKNNNFSQTVRLYPGERLCQIVFEQLSHPVENRKSKYHLKDVIDGFSKETTTESDSIKKGEIREFKDQHAVDTN